MRDIAYEDILPWDEYGNRELVEGTLLVAGTHTVTGRIHLWDLRLGIWAETVVGTREEADAELSRMYPSRHQQLKVADLADPPGSG